MVTFCVTAPHKNDAKGNFRAAVMSLRADDPQACILSAFHITDSYALLAAKGSPPAHAHQCCAPAPAGRRRLPYGPD